MKPPSKIVTDNETEYLMELVEQNGVACATVSDGTVLVFKRTMLQKLLDTTEGKDVVTMFVQRPSTTKS